MSSLVALSALPASVQALHQACAHCGGFDYLRCLSSGGKTVTVDDFCGFCEGNLRMDGTTALSILTLLDTSNDVVKIPKLIAVLKVLQPLAFVNPSCMEASAASRVFDIVDSSCNASLLDELAGILDVEAIDLHADFTRGGPAAVLQQLEGLLQRVTHSRRVQSIPNVRLPQGTSAPYVAARQGASTLGFQVPIWSLRAVHQSKSSSSSRIGIPDCLSQLSKVVYMESMP